MRCSTFNHGVPSTLAWPPHPARIGRRCREFVHYADLARRRPSPERVVFCGMVWAARVDFCGTGTTGHPRNPVFRHDRHNLRLFPRLSRFTPHNSQLQFCGTLLRLRCVRVNCLRRACKAAEVGEQHNACSFSTMPRGTRAIRLFQARVDDWPFRGHFSVVFRILR